jgi:hypothetical protein
MVELDEDFFTCNDERKRHAHTDTYPSHSQLDKVADKVDIKVREAERRAESSAMGPLAIANAKSCVPWHQGGFPARVSE